MRQRHRELRRRRRRRKDLAKLAKKLQGARGRDARQAIIEKMTRRAPWRYLELQRLLG